MASLLQQNNLKAVVPAAQLCMRQFGIPASVTLAQWIVESSWGCSQLALQAKNFFGVKWTHLDNELYVEMPTAEYLKGVKTIVEADFVKYDNADESFQAHATLLAEAWRYAPAMKVRWSPARFADALQACGYSTNPHYAADLMTLVVEEKLAQYDTLPPDESAALKEAA
jgi:flagellum-specific peptidoglycan hydrolase FlgJ